MRKLLTLCIIHQHPRILLGMKKRGFGVGRWNGFGGKVHKGETVEKAARRETREEAGIDIGIIEETGVLEFSFAGNAEALEVHIFRATSFSGEPIETEEMRPQWFEIDAIPFDAMWPDDRYWLPLLLAGKKFKGAFTFGPSDRIIKYTIAED